MTITTQITFNHLDDLLKELLNNKDALVQQLAESVITGFQNRVAVDTGAEQQSVYLITKNGVDTYTTATGEEFARRPKTEPLPEMSLPSTDAGNVDAIVAVAAPYGAVQEFGGVHTHAHPALVPAAESAIETTMNAVGTQPLLS